MQWLSETSLSAKKHDMRCGAGMGGIEIMFSIRETRGGGGRAIKGKGTEYDEDCERKGGI